MILWVILFLLVVAISFVLAAKSMSDFQEIPTNDIYSLFLVKNTHALTSELLDSIGIDLLKSKQVISFERLIKGDKAALVVYLPSSLASKYRSTLDLMELEDYTLVDGDEVYVQAWEMGIKKAENLLLKFPILLSEEQFWMQFVISAKKDSTYGIHIRAILISSDERRRKELTSTLQKMSEGLSKLPKAFSNAQILDFYKRRSFASKNPNLASDKIIDLLKV